MGNNPGGEEAPNKSSFLCQANRQDRKVKSKRNTSKSLYNSNQTRFRIEQH